jgi:hypothetical protein
MDKVWDKEKDKNSDFADGQYTFRFQEGKIEESKKSGGLLVILTHVCVKGDNEGVSLSQVFAVENDFAKRNLAKTLRALGVEPPKSLGDVEELLDEMAGQGIVFNGAVVNKGGYTNLYVNQLEEGVAVPVSEEKETDKGEHVKPAIEKKTATDDTKVQLIAFAQAQGYNVEDDVSQADIIEALKGEVWDAEKLTPEEQALLTKVGIDVAKPAAVPVKKKVGKK